MIASKSYLDLAVVMLGALLISDGFNLIGAFVGSIFWTKAAAMVVLCTYLLIYRATLQQVLSDKVIVVLLLLWACWPCLSLLWAAEPASISDLGRIISSAALIAALGVFCYRVGPSGVHHLAAAAFLLVFFGIVASLVFPGLFEKLGEIQAERGMETRKLASVIVEKGRAIGFQAQANKAAHATVFTFLLWTYTAGNRSAGYRVLGIVVATTSIFLTGSRAGLLCLFACCIADWAWILIRSPRWWQEEVKSGRIIVQAVFGIVSVFLILILASDQLRTSQPLLDRVMSVSPGEVAATIKTDRSLVGRIEIAQFWLRASLESPLIGRGINGMRALDTAASSHNTFLEIIVDYGYCYTLVLSIVILVVVFTKRTGVDASRLLMCGVIPSFVVAWFISWNSRNGGMVDPPFCAVLGFFVGVSFYLRRRQRPKHDVPLSNV